MTETGTPEKVCGVEGCGRPFVAKGFCAIHYYRQKYRDKAKPRTFHRNKGAVCSIDDCAKPAQARGYCDKHYQRYFRYGDPLCVRPAGRIPAHAAAELPPIKPETETDPTFQGYLYSTEMHNRHLDRQEWKETTIEMLQHVDCLTVWLEDRPQFRYLFPLLIQFRREVLQALNPGVMDHD